MSNICTPCYDNQYPVFATQAGAVGMNIAIQHPNVFYFVLDGSWSSTNSLEYWNKGNTFTNTNNYPINKTIYDPSFYLFVLPKTGSCSGFTTTGTWTTTQSKFNVNGAFSSGWSFYCQPNFMGTTIFFSALGYRAIASNVVTSSTSGKILGVSTACDYWTCGPTTSSINSMGLGFDTKGIYPPYDFARAYGFSTRCVLE